MAGRSITPEKEKLNALRQVLPEVFSEGKVDWEKLKAALGENINFANERYVLNWAGKSDAFKVLQAPTTKTLIPAKNESVNFNETGNIFIEGENLEVLKVLQKSYFGKVKMIYIDPPYNTGNDSFIYPDKFSESKAEYEKRVGDKDEDGYLTKDTLKFPSIGGVPQAGWSKNSKENGQYHSNWLNMMMPRLYLAKNLLRQDGVIFVSIDDNEVHNLRLLMNEIFGEENFVAELIWKKRVSPANDSQWFSSDHEYVIVYAKNKENWLPIRLDRTQKQNSYYSNPDNDPRGPWNSAAYTCNKNKDERPNLYYPLINPNTGEEVWPKETAVWAYAKGTYEEHIKANLLYWGGDGKSNSPRKKQFLTEAKPVVSRSFLEHSDVGSTQSATLDFLKLFDHNYFSYTKPVELIKRLIKISSASDSNEIIMDFFAGSGTTAHSLFEIKKELHGNQRFVCVQLPELCDEKSQSYKDGYKTIADISKERIRRAGKKIQEEINAEIKKLEAEIAKLQGELPTEETLEKIQNLEFKIQNLHNQDLGFKVLKLDDSNFKQWQQIESKNAKALEEQMKLFVDPVSESATIENMVYELLLKSGKDLNSNIEEKFPSCGGVPAGRGGSKEVQIGRNSQNYFNLPINPKLKKRARELRQAGNLAEVLFWNQVKSKQFKGFDFDRQKIVGNYIVDFYCCNCNVVIEIDGSSHNDKQEYDAERDAYLKSLGLTVIHIEDADVKKNISGVMDMLYHHPALKGTPPKEGNLTEKLKTNYYSINEGELILILEKASQEIIDSVISEKPIKVIALDRLFKGNDQLKTNTILQMKDAGIEFKTI